MACDLLNAMTIRGGGGHGPGSILSVSLLVKAQRLEPRAGGLSRVGGEPAPPALGGVGGYAAQDPAPGSWALGS